VKAEHGKTRRGDPQITQKTQIAKADEDRAEAYAQNLPSSVFEICVLCVICGSPLL
jgi:hypothetical protein